MQNCSELEYGQILNELDENNESSYKKFLHKPEKLFYKCGYREKCQDMLEELFRRACDFVLLRKSKQQVNLKLNEEPVVASIGVAIDIAAYGSQNAKMAITLVSSQNELISISIVDDHVGNLKLLPEYDRSSIEFVEQFKYLLMKAFQCFGKRWYELDDSERACSSDVQIELVEIEQDACVRFVETDCYYSIDEIVSAFVESMLACVGLDVFDEASINRLNKLSIVVPSNFHTYQRIRLRHCMDRLGIGEKIYITNKSIALVLPFASKNIMDASKKLIIDFGSGINVFVSTHFTV
jgi:hypothetical protein